MLPGAVWTIKFYYIMKYHLWMGISAMIALLCACGGHAHHDHEGELHHHEEELLSEGHAHEEGHTDEIILKPEKAEAAGIKVEEIQPSVFREVIEASGQLLSAQGEETTVVANVSGVVSFSRALTEGTAVSTGAGLMTISADKLQDGDPVKRARVAYETARMEYERAAKLVEKRIVSQKEFNGLKEKYENARIAYEALSPGRNGKGVSVSSPLTGYIKICLVKEGDYVNMGQPLFSVTRNKKMQLRADVSERFYPALRGVTSAHFRLSYSEKVYRLEDLNGKLLSFGKSASDNSFYLPVTFELDNCGDLLPGTFAEVYLLGQERSGVISLPVSALTEEQGVHFVYQQLDESCYKKLEVKVGTSNGEAVEILAGLRGGEKIVTQGAVHVKLASASNAIPGHTHNH